jgi:hypothetical protein
MQNVFDIQCSKCGSGYDLYMLDQTDPTPRPGIRFIESEDGKSATEMLEVGEWIPLSAYWGPEDMERLTTFLARLKGKSPIGIPVWCASCGSEAAFEDFDGDLAIRARQCKALEKAIGLLFGRFPEERGET